MTLDKHNGQTNNLKYHFHLFTRRGDLLLTNSLFFAFIAIFWRSQKSNSIVCLMGYKNKFSSPDGSCIPFAESKADEERKPQELIF